MLFSFMENPTWLSWLVPLEMIDIILLVSQLEHVSTAQTGDWRREEEFTDVTLVYKSGTQERGKMESTW